MKPSLSDIMRTDDSCYGFMEGSDLWKKRYGNRDKREVCQYCKNENTERVIDSTDLNSYTEYYKRYYDTNKFKVMHCFMCNAQWHWSLEK